MTRAQGPATASNVYFIKILFINFEIKIRYKTFS